MPVTKAPSKKSLLEDLKNSDDPMEKRKIRAALRKLGHTGGLGEGRGRPAGSSASSSKGGGKSSSKKKSGKRARPAPTADEDDGDLDTGGDED